MSDPVIDWDGVRAHPVRQGDLEAVFFNLGAAASTVTVGLRREQIAAGKRALPPHMHTGDEETFFVLSGAGLSWQDGSTYPVGPGDCLMHVPGREAHALVAGSDGLDVLAFGERVQIEASVNPRGGVAWLDRTWVETGSGAHPWERDAAAGELPLPEPGERPPRIVNIADVEPIVTGRGGSHLTRRMLTRGHLQRTGLQHVALAPGKMGFPPHCHSAQEELFVVLEGEGTLLLFPSSGPGTQPPAQEHAVRPGSVISRPAGTAVAHAFRAGDAGLTYLAYGTRQSWDTTWYPRSQKLAMLGLHVIGRLERCEYWDGEE
jgi:uncharacterized cupin superfamily protein